MEHKQAFQYLQHLSKKKKVERDTDSITDNLAFLGIRLQNETYYLVIDQVKEIIPNPVISPVGHSRSWLEGLIKVQGEIYSVVDLAEFLGYPPIVDKHRFVIALSQEVGNYALQVSQVLGITNFMQPEKTGEDDYLDNYRSDTKSIKVLSVERMLGSADFANISVF